MIPIKNIGGYFKTDTKGYLINPASLSHIPSLLIDIIEDIKMRFLHFYNDDLQSLYLRGSVVRGTYEGQVSDLDFAELELKHNRFVFMGRI